MIVLTESVGIRGGCPSGHPLLAAASYEMLVSPDVHDLPIAMPGADRDVGNQKVVRRESYRKSLPPLSEKLFEGVPKT